VVTPGTAGSARIEQVPDPRPEPGQVLLRTLENRAVFGSVNAHPQDWVDAVRRLTAVRERWPEAAERLVGLRVPPDRFADAFAFRGGKSTVQFA
jgi:hypothetical protein